MKHSIRIVAASAVFTAMVAVMPAIAQNAEPDTDPGSGIYQWTDENGTVHFGELPPPGVDAKAVEVAPAPAVSTPAYRESDSGGADAGAEGEAAMTPGAKARAERQARAEQAAAAASEREAMESLCARAREQVINLESRPNVLVDDGSGGTRRLPDEERLEMLADAKAFVADNCN